jgi:phage terminase large subunit-like protein
VTVVPALIPTFIKGRLKGEEQNWIVLALTELELEHDRALPAGNSWSAMARLEQLPPGGDWRTWLLLAGRGFGKTRAGAEAINAWARAGTARRIAVVAQTIADVRDLSVAALRAAAGPDVTYTETKHYRLEWPNGAVALGFSAEDPDSLRGYEFDTAWCDELAAWRYPESYDQLQFGLRARGARQIVTTTPRPVRVVRDLIADPSTVVTRGRTADNAANLDPATLRFLFTRYGATRLGRQELEAELLDNVPGALWTRERIDELRVAATPEFSRIVVAVDPAVSSSEDADETGMIVAAKGVDGQGYVLADLSCRASPDGWARRAVEALPAWGADRIVAEVNQGGDLVEATIRTIDPGVPYRAVHASRGKRTRAEPVAALYEQGRIHHVGSFPALEDQLCAALPDGGSGPDDRLDALVWAFTELGLAGSSLDVPGVIDWQFGVWLCGCGHRQMWAPARRCPRCGTPAPETYDEPLPPPADQSGDEPIRTV